MDDLPQEQRGTAPASAPFQLYVDPAFRPEPIEAPHGIRLAGAAAVIVIGVAVAALSLLRNEPPVEARLDAARAAETAISPPSMSQPSQPPIPLIPPISAPAPVAGPVAEVPAPDKVAATATAPETPTQSSSTHDDQTKPRAPRRYRPALTARIEPRGDGPPIDAADLPPLDGDTPQHAN